MYNPKEQPKTPDELTEFYTHHLKLVSEISQQMSSVQKMVEDKSPDENTLALKRLTNHLHFTGLILGGMLDCTTITKGLSHSHLYWDKLYYFRKIYLTMYEMIRTLDKHNQIILEIVNNRNEVAKALYRRIMQVLKKFKKEYKFDSEMAKIRNTIGGHIHTNFSEYYDQLNKFDMQQAAKAVLAFSKIQKSLLDLSLAILSGPELDSIEDQILKSNLPPDTLKKIKALFDSM